MKISMTSFLKSLNICLFKWKANCNAHKMICIFDFRFLQALNAETRAAIGYLELFQIVTSHLLSSPKILFSLCKTSSMVHVQISRPIRWALQTQSKLKYMKIFFSNLELELVKCWLGESEREAPPKRSEFGGFAILPTENWKQQD